jgi:hypothetical protein
MKVLTHAALMAAALAVSPAWAVNKCTGPDGSVTYQEAACDSRSSANSINVGSSPPATSNAETSRAKQLPVKAIAVSNTQMALEVGPALQIARASMKDPDSMKTQGVRVFAFEALGRKFVMTCGEINAKNSFGGYTGFKPFWIYDGVFTQTFNHFLPTQQKLEWLMGDAQSECLRSGVPSGIF